MQKALLMAMALLWFAGLASGQSLAESRRSASNAYIFKLDDAQMASFAADPWVKTDTTWFRLLVDSFPADSTYQRILPPGHYMMVRIHENRIRLSYLQAPTFYPVLVNNEMDLVIRVTTTDGLVISDAGVRIKGKKIPYDTVLQAYRLPESGRDGVLEITHQGITAWYRVDARFRHPRFRRTLRDLPNTPVVNYVWIPVRFVGRIPIQIYRSVEYGYPVGIVQRLTNGISHCQCLLDKNRCYRSDDLFSRKHSGYLVFNKPKYHPGDTLFYKAFVIRDRSGKPTGKEALVSIKTYPVSLCIDTIRAYRKGAYTGYFVLSDTMPLKLDRQYSLELSTKRRKRGYISNYFRYEDYVLNGLSLHLTAPTAIHYHGQPFYIEADAKDENRLPLKEGRFEVIIRRRGWIDFPGSEPTFLYDTLASFTHKLTPEGTNRILISDTTFPVVNVSYEAEVTLFAADNRKVVKSSFVTYYHTRKEAAIELLGDSVLFSYKVNGIRNEVEGQIFITKIHQPEVLVYDGILPHSLRFDPYVLSYRLQANGENITRNISDVADAMVQCSIFEEGQIQQVEILNPRRLPLIWFVYHKNREVDRGSGEAARVNLKYTGKKYLTVKVHYTIAGIDGIAEARLLRNECALNVQITAPEVVYPGQMTEVDIRVTDPAGKPVAGADITAYGLNANFHHQSERPPLYSCRLITLHYLNSYKMFSMDEYPRSIPLDYPRWKHQAMLDSISWYRLAYPEDGMAMERFVTTENITQVSPWLVRNGSFLTPRAIYIDYQPVWVDWATVHNPMAFKVYDGRHNFRLVTNDAIYSFDTLITGKGMHTHLSFDINNPPAALKIEKADPQKMKAELRSLQRMTMVYDPKLRPYETRPYLTQGDRVWDLKSSESFSYREIVAPLTQSESNFIFPDNSIIQFQYMPDYRYKVRPGLLVMTSLNQQEMERITCYPNMESRPQIGEQVITLNQLKVRYFESIKTDLPFKSFVDFSGFSPLKNGTLVVKSPFSHANTEPLLLFLFHYSSSQWAGMSGGSVNAIEKLVPGHYALMYLFEDGSYALYDSLVIKPKCISFHPLHPNPIRSIDTLSQGALEILQRLLSGKNPYHLEMVPFLTHSPHGSSLLSQRNSDQGVIEGYVLSSSLEPIPYANITMNNFSLGTISDSNGYYRLKVPVASFDLLVTYIGFETMMVKGAKPGRMNLILEESKMTEMSMVTSYSIAIRRIENYSRASAFFAGSSDHIGHKYYVDGVQTVRARELQRLPSATGNIQYSYIDNPKKMNINGFSADTIYDFSPFRGTVVNTTPEAHSSLRQDFSDYAFWEPKLTTDKNGQAKFKVTFPDDITAWDTWFLVMGGKRQTGFQLKTIQSYKPLVAQLHVPRFLVAGDTSRVIGAVTNHGSDTVMIERRFEQSAIQVFAERQSFLHHLTDSFNVTTGVTDSLWLKYTIHKADGYFDGELRGVPVIAKGMEEITGQLYLLHQDEEVSLRFDTAKGEVRLQILADLPTLIRNELQTLVDYKYECNEQLASRLIALLLQQELETSALKKASNMRRIKRTIEQLIDNRNTQGLWGWWKGSPTTWWITEHVFSALYKARTAGVMFSLPFLPVMQELYREYDQQTSVDQKLLILKCIMMMRPAIQPDILMALREHRGAMTPRQQFRLWELEQLAGIRVEGDSVLRYLQSSFTGEAWFGRDSLAEHPTDDALLSTNIALHVLKDTTITSDTIVPNVLNWLLQYPQHHSLNTYTRALWVDALMTHHHDVSGAATPPQVVITGSLDQTISTFPFTTTLSSDAGLVIKSLSFGRVFVSTDQRHQVTDPGMRNQGFSVETRFDRHDSVMTAGREITLWVDVTVEKGASYVMIEVPIPAGCVYGEPNKTNPWEAWREQYKEGTSIFCERLPAGKHTFAIPLLPRFTGSYSLNPARAEMMYFPVFNGNSEIKRVKVVPGT